MEKTEHTWSRIPTAGRNRALLQKWKKELTVSLLLPIKSTYNVLLPFILRSFIIQKVSSIIVFLTSNQALPAFFHISITFQDIKIIVIPLTYAHRTFETPTYYCSLTWHLFFQKLNRSKYCADIGLLDQKLFERCFAFYSSVTEYLFKSLAEKTEDDRKDKELSPDDLLIGDANNGAGSMESKRMSSSSSSNLSTTIGNTTLKFPMSSNSGKVFASLPEWIVEDVADFALFSLQ